MRESFWQKIDDAKATGLTAEQFERIENLEAAIERQGGTGMHWGMSVKAGASLLHPLPPSLDLDYLVF